MLRSLLLKHLILNAVPLEVNLQKKAEDYRKKAKDLVDDNPRKTELETKAKQIDDNLRLFDGITSALYAPNSNGIIGDVTRAVSPQVAYQIGQYFKENKLKNEIDSGNRPEEQSPQHLLAHAVLGAAVSAATGNDITAGALAGATSEKTAPILASYLYGKDTKELTQEQKDTVTSIITLGTAGIAYGASDGSVSDAVNASEVGKVGVENNNLSPIDFGPIANDLSSMFYAEKWKQEQGNSNVHQQSQSSDSNLPFLFYIMPEHTTPFLNQNQQSAAKQIKPIVQLNRGAATATGYAPYVIGATTVLPASTTIGSTTTVAGYHITTPKDERTTLGYVSNAVTGGVGGVVVTSAKNTKQAIGIGIATAYSNQVISSKGDDLSPKPSHIINGVASGTGKYLGGYHCGDVCQTSIIAVPNTAIGKVSDELYKKGNSE